MSYKKILVSLVLLALVSASLIRPIEAVKAQDSPWWNPTYQDFATRVSQGADNEIFGERYTYAQVTWIIDSLILLIGGDAAQCASTTLDGGANQGARFAQCIAESQANGGHPGPIIAVASGIDSFMANKPASGVQYVAEVVNKVRFAQPAYAQGYGYSNSLAPIQTLWAASRNAAYALSTLAIIALAFMVMFRARLSPQTVVTVQSAIPKIIIALLLITFSYAIAGFLVDLAFVVQGVVGAIATLQPTQISNLTTVQMFNQLNDGVGSVVAYGIGFIVQAIAPGGGGIVGQFSNISGGGQVFLGWITGIIDLILALIIFIVLLIALVRIFWLMIITYAKVLFLVIGGPFIALIGAVGSNNSFFNWVKQIVAQLSVFVSIGVIVFIGHVLFYGFGNVPGEVLQAIINSFGGRGLNVFGVFTNLAPGQNVGYFPTGFSFTNTRAIGFFVSLAVMLSIPKIANSIRDQIASGRAQFGLDVGGGLAPATGTIGFLGGRYMGREAELADIAARYSGGGAAAAQRAGRFRAASEFFNWVQKQGGGGRR